jgi:hypothetical protein
MPAVVQTPTVSARAATGSSAAVEQKERDQGRKRSGDAHHEGA